MVRARTLSGFLRQERGLAMVEGLVVFPLVLLAFAAFFEFGYAVFQWNQTVKALQLGARLAAVSDPITDISSLYGSGSAGDPMPYDPTDIQSVSCGYGTTPCDTNELNRLVYGTDDKCSTNYGTSLPGMCDFNDRIAPSNILITYYQTGLGYIGRPDGPVLTIEMQVEGLTFDLPLVGALLGLGAFTIPAHPVTITSEDLCSTKTC